MKKFSLVLPIKIELSNFLGGDGKTNDLDRLIQIQLFTFNKFIDRDSLDKFYIIGRPDEIETIERECIKHYPDFPFVFMSENDINPNVEVKEHWKHIVNQGHLMQQIVQLGISNFVDTDHYIILNCDNFLARPFSYDDMFHNDKVIFTGIETPEKPHPIHFWQHSIHVLDENIKNIEANKEKKSGLYDETLCYKKFMSVTPQIYITSEIKNLLKNIEEKHNDDWCKTLLGKTYGGARSWSESSLYWTYLTLNNKVENLYSFDGPGLFGNELWRYAEDAAMERMIDKYLSEIGCVFNQEKIGEWRSEVGNGEINDKYYFSLVQSNIKQLTTEKLATRIKEVVGD
jgi:hypothetical protein